MTTGAVIESLKAAAGQGDPGPAIYVRLFAAFPELDALFVRDRDGSVRGHMLAQSWTEEMEQAWSRLLVQIQDLMQPAPASGQAAADSVA